MKQYIVLLTAVLATGCATYNVGNVPDAVAVMPNDCANFRAIETFLIERSEADKSPIVTEEHYETQKSHYKRALWQLRYNCNPAS